MGDDYNSQRTTAWSFLKEPEAKERFGKLDYALRRGVHIQDTRNQYESFRFLIEHLESLKLFYWDYYNVVLDTLGETTNKYFFIDFAASGRGNIPEENRSFLPNEFVIVGFMLYKIIYIDGYIDLNSLSRLQKMIRQDYEELKNGLYRTLAKAKREKPTQMNDERVDKVIHDAMYEFNKIGWIDLRDDSFEVLPAFQRLIKIYGDYINDLDNWLKNDNNDETVS